ncbi:unnamed protein product [Rotaria sordida]|uniref:Uncharacterized protein n=1 Tax=Rotaria sordida TaxID=392033 RepID=A0A814QAR1_9BILA|nr:unnamed protein product [Rotaria sordida]
MHKKPDRPTTSLDECLLEFQEKVHQKKPTPIAPPPLPATVVDEDLHQKHLVDHSSSPSYTGANIDIQHHEIIKPTQTTSDYYNTDELADEQRSTIINNTEWSIEKILYPDWLYKDILMTSKKHLNTSTFNNINSYQTSIDEKQIISSNNQSSPKQVRFDYQKQIRSYPHLNTTVQQLKTRTITTVSNNDIHNTFI